MFQDTSPQPVDPSNLPSASPSVTPAASIQPVAPSLNTPLMQTSAAVRFSPTIPREYFEKLLNPKSVALIGASEAPEAVGHEVLNNIVAGNFNGPLYLVNPKYSATTSALGSGLNYSAAVADLPDHAIDLAVVMTRSNTVPKIIDELGTKGVRAVVLISAGFKEMGGDGLRLEAELEAAAKKHNIALVGPNCLGLANTSDEIKLNATFVKGSPLAGSGALVSQSGAVGIDIMDRAHRLGLGVSQFVSIGNSMRIGSTELMHFWADDPRVKYIMGYLESVNDPAAFREVAKSISKEKPILMIKSGRSSAGAKAASSHTGSLAGSDNAVDALFAQCGVMRMGSIQELFAGAQAFEYCKPSRGPNVAIFSNAGGYAVMATDIIELEKGGLKVAQLSAQTEADLKPLLPDAASKHNPVDTTATMPREVEKFKQGLLKVLADPQVDSCIVSIVPVMDITALDMATAAAEAQEQSGKPVVAMISCGETELQRTADELRKTGIAPVALYSCVEDAVSALSTLENHRIIREKQEEMPTLFTDVDKVKVAQIFDGVKKEGRKLLTTSESLDVMTAYKIAVPQFSLVSDINDALSKANQLGYPLVLKLCSKTHSHKTDVGGVELDIRTPEQLKQKYAEMEQKLATHGIGNYGPGEGLMLQQFLPKGREVIMGVNDDPKFGKMLMLGMGGVYVEVMKDVKFRLHPITRQDVREMIDGLKTGQILKGVRGKPGVDFQNLEDTLLRLSQLVADFPELDELDINPFMALPKAADGTAGGIAVDARMEI